MPHRLKRGFTMIELLVVIVIIGVILIMVMPTFSTGSDIARVKTATRGVMQMSRYARTMALLRQTPLDLVFTSDGHLSVAVGGNGGGESLVQESAFGVTNAAARIESQGADETGGVEEAETDVAGKKGGGASYVMADVEVTHAYERVSFVFDGYTDTLEDQIGRRLVSGSDDEEAEAARANEVQTFRVRYKSNGTCRPYRVKVMAEKNEASEMMVAVDMLGGARVEDEEE